MRVVLALALLFSASPARATGALVQASDHPLLQEGLVHLYSLDYDRLVQNAVSFRDSHPTNPLGHLFLSGALWWQYTTESEQLRPDTDFLDRFDDYVDATVSAAKPLMRSRNDEARADGLFAAGMVLGLRGQMKLANGQFFGAYRDGKKGIKFLKKCVKIDPEYHDALMGLGIFDYQVAVLPGVLKFGAKLLFRGTGNASRGIRRIRNAITHGRFANNQAAGFLLTIFMLNEHDYRQALGVAKDLHAAFPKSPYYGFIHASLLHRNGSPKESRLAMREIFDYLAAEPDRFARKQLGTVCGLFGPACFDRANLIAANSWISQTLSAEMESSEYIALLTLYRGIARDLLGKRAEALEDYRALATLPEIISSRAWGGKFAGSKCTKADALRLLRGGRP